MRVGLSLYWKGKSFWDWEWILKVKYWTEKRELLKHGVDEKHIKVHLIMCRLGACRIHVGLPKNIE
jgi:hypothetical protein